MLKVYIDGNELKQSDKNGGVCGEHNSTEMLLSFGEDWTGYNKKVVFYNAYGANPVTVLLTEGLKTENDTDNPSGGGADSSLCTREPYIIRIPGEALEFEGKAEYVVEGVCLDGEMVAARKKSVCGIIRVRYSPSSESEKVPAEVAATVGEQLQSEAKRIQKKVDEVTGIAVNSAPYIGNNGNWFVFDAETKTHKDSDTPSRGEKGDTGPAPYIGADGYWYVAGTNTGYKAYLSVSVARNDADGCVDVSVENPDGSKHTAKVYDGVSAEISVTRDEVNRRVHIQSKSNNERQHDAFVYDGANGVSPKIMFSRFEGGVRIQAENADGSFNFADVYDGKNGKSPKIIDGTWCAWDDDLGQYVDTGVSAKGESSIMFVEIAEVIEADGFHYKFAQPFEEIRDWLMSGGYVIGKVGSGDICGITYYATAWASDAVYFSNFINATSPLISEYTELIFWQDESVEIRSHSLVDKGAISADNENFKTAVLNCFPDADTMSFPLEETVSEVSEE